MKSFVVTCPQCSNQFEPIEAQSQFINGEVDRILNEGKQLLAKQQKELKVKEDALKKSAQDINEKVESELKTRLAELEKKTLVEAARKVEVKFKDLQNQINEKELALKDSNEEQLKLTKLVREANERQKQLDLEVEQKVLEKVEVVEGEAMKRADEHYKLKIAEKEKKIKDIESQLEAARRTAEQGSQQSQGEVVEIDFENQLKAQFPLDKFEPVPKGVDGADLIQTVHNASARKCGTLIWEFKNTKNFSAEWIAKLKRDQQRINADAAILVTRTLPKDAQDAELIDGVLVVSYDLAVSMAKVIRKSLEDISFALVTTQGQDEKMKLIYNYLTGSQFRLKVKAIVAAFTQMKSDLDGEKRAFKRMWASREKLLEHVIDSATSMYGDIEGIAGTAAPHIEGLTLSTPDLLDEPEEQIEA